MLSLEHNKTYLFAKYLVALIKQKKFYLMKMVMHKKSLTENTKLKKLMLP